MSFSDFSLQDLQTRFGLTVTVGMAGIRRASRYFEPAPDNDGTGDVEGRLDPISDQDIRVAEKAGENFGGGHHEINDQPKQGDARAGLQIAGNNVRCRVQRRCHL